MHTAQFVLALVGILAWPVTMLTVILVIRHELQKPEGRP